MVGPHEQRGADLALITGAIVDAGDARLVPGNVIKYGLDDMRQNAEPVRVCMQVFAPATAVTSGNGAIYFFVPPSLAGKNLTYVQTDVIASGSTNTTNVQVSRNRSGSTVSMLSTVCSIDSAETSSLTAATPAVIDLTKDDVAAGDKLRIDLTQVSTTPPSGLYVTLEFS